MDTVGGLNKAKGMAAAQGSTVKSTYLHACVEKATGPSSFDNPIETTSDDRASNRIPTAPHDATW